MDYITTRPVVSPCPVDATAGGRTARRAIAALDMEYDLAALARGVRPSGHGMIHADPAYYARRASAYAAADADPAPAPAELDEETERAQLSRDLFLAACSTVPADAVAWYQRAATMPMSELREWPRLTPQAQVNRLLAGHPAGAVIGGAVHAPTGIHAPPLSES